MVIELDNLYWFPETDKGISDIRDPFSDLLGESLLDRLLWDYQTWCVDMRLIQLRETKAFGTNKADTSTRDSMYLSAIISSPNYKKNLRTQKSQAGKQYEMLASEALREFNLMLKQYRSGKKKFAELRRDSADYFEHFYKRVWLAGRKASGLDLYLPEMGPTKEELKWLNSAIKEELTFWQSFMQEIENERVLFTDELSLDQIILAPPARRYTVEERLQMYLNGLQGVFESGRVSGMPSNLLFYWFGPKVGDAGMCKGCTYVVERHPFTKDNMPIIPRMGGTSCLTFCRHKIVVRQATVIQIDERNRALPTKATMVKQLAALKESKPKYKVKGKLVSPWQKK